MPTPSTQTKVFVIGLDGATFGKMFNLQFKLRLIFCLVVAAIFINGCDSQQSVSTDKAPTREDAIPKDVTKVTPEADVFPPILHATNEWNTPVSMGTLINTAGIEDSPVITLDGKTLYFFFTPDARKSPNEQLFDGVTGIWYTTKTESGWKEPQRIYLNERNKEALDSPAFVQGNVLWFYSVRQGNYGEIDVYTVEAKNGEYTNWRNAGETLNKDFDVGELHITADGNEMYFGSTREGGKGKSDIWFSSKVGGQWQNPSNVSILNTSEDENQPFLTEDGNELWFTRTYLGTPAIFRSRKISDSWTTPEVIVSSFAGDPILDNNGNLYFVHHFYNQEGKMIEADIYVAYKK